MNKIWMYIRHVKCPLNAHSTISTEIVSHPGTYGYRFSNLDIGPTTLFYFLLFFLFYRPCQRNKSNYSNANL